MKYRSLIRCLALICAFTVSAGNANLTTLAVNFLPDQESFAIGETVSVSLETDVGVAAEYRFLLQVYQNEGWDDLVLTDWSLTSEYALSTALEDAPGGNYRLAAYARDPDNPDEFIINYQTFLLMSEGMTVCSWLDGKTLESSGDELQLEVDSGGIFDAMDAMADLQASLDESAHAIASLSFAGGEASMVLSVPGRITSFGGADFNDTHYGPLSGAYECEGTTVTMSLAEEIKTYNCGGTLSFLGCPDGHLTISGTADVDMAAGTLSAGDTVFRLPNSGEASAPDGSSGSSSGSFPLISVFALGLLCLLRVRRRYY